MPVIDVKRFARKIDNKIKQKYQFFNEDTGELEVRNMIIEDTIEQSVSLNAVDAINKTVTLSVIVENITSQISSNQNNVFFTENNYIPNSLSVFYNGLNITSDISETDNDAFTIDSIYDNFDNEDKLVVSYVKSQI